MHEGVSDLQKVQNNERSEESIKSLAHGNAGFYPQGGNKKIGAESQQTTPLGL